jgi:single-stranded DNA-binding protein
VVAESVQFLEPKGNGGYQPPTDAPPERGQNNDPFSGNGIDIPSDDLPF